MTKPYKTVFLIVLILLCIRKTDWWWYTDINYESFNYCVAEILEDNNTVYGSLRYQEMLLPYFKNINFKSYGGDDLTSFENFKNIHTKIPKLDVEKLKKEAPVGSYLFVNNREFKQLEIVSGRSFYNLYKNNSVKVCNGTFIIKLK